MIRNLLRIWPLADRRHRRGFTLIELLVVISIITVLATMLMPTLSAARRAVYNMRSKSRLAELSTGAVKYAIDNSNIYPGQLYPDRLKSTAGGTFTGSQYLAIALFGLNMNGAWQITGKAAGDASATDNYAPYATGSTQQTCDLQQIDLMNTSIWDKYPASTPLAVCYYPANTGIATLSQYKEADNSDYTDAHPCDPNGDTSKNWTGAYPSTDTGAFPGNAFEKAVKDRRLVTQGSGNSSTTPFKSGAFILIAPGIDRRYGTADDVTNFGG